jgi:hypothetical protein
MNPRHSSEVSPPSPCEAAAAEAPSRDVLLSPPAQKRRGAPKGNRNAVTHGRYTADQRALRKRIRALIKNVHATLGGLSPGAKKRRLSNASLPLVRSGNS